MNDLARDLIGAMDRDELRDSLVHAIVILDGLCRKFPVVALEAAATSAMAGHPAPTVERDRYADLVSWGYRPHAVLPRTGMNNLTPRRSTCPPPCRCHDAQHRHLRLPRCRDGLGCTRAVDVATLDGRG